MSTWLFSLIHRTDTMLLDSALPLRCNCAITSSTHLTSASWCELADAALLAMRKPCEDCGSDGAREENSRQVALHCVCACVIFQITM